MRKKIIRFLFIPFLISLAACSHMEVNTARAPDVNLSQYRTYAWVQSSDRATSVTDQTVKSNIEDQLINKGLVPVKKDGKPDVLISYSTEQRNGFSRGLAPTDWGWDEEAVYPIREGSLKIQFIDPKTNRAIWEGTSSDFIGRAGPTQTEIAESVMQILKKYPSS